MALFEVPWQILRNGSYRFMQAYARFFKGLSQRPSRKRRLGRQTVLLTKELFQFTATGKTTKVNDGLVEEHKLMIGTERFMVGELKFTAHRPYELPNSICISRHNSQWHVSFSYGDAEFAKDTLPLMSEEKLIEYFSGLTEEELEEIANGGDRGVVIPVAMSNGKGYDFTGAEKKSPAEAQRLRKKLQEKLSNQCKGSRRRERTKVRIDKTYAKERNIREDRAHKISHDIVEDTAQVNIFEDLQVSNMVRKPKVKRDANGEFLKNGAKAKAGLNKSILNSMWGRIVTFSRYKGLKNREVNLPPTLSVACEGKTTDNVLRLALKVFILSVLLTDLVGSLKVWGLRPHTPPLTMSVAWAKESNYLCIGATSEPLFMVIILIFRRHVSRKEEV